MSRAALSALFKASAFSQETDQIYLCFLSIAHSSITTIRVVNNGENVDSGGNTYIGYPFEINLPNDTDENVPDITLQIDNIDRQIVQAVRSVTGPPTVSIFIALQSTPNTIEIGPINMTLREVNYDSLVVSGVICPEDILNESFPGDFFVPATFPALF